MVGALSICILAGLHVFSLNSSVLAGDRAWASLSITAPIGGAVIQGGTTYTVTWNVSAYSGITLDLIDPSYNLIQRISDGMTNPPTPPNCKSVTWNVPSNLWASNYRLFIQMYDYSGNIAAWYYTGYFSIYGPPTVTGISPTSGQVGTVVTINGSHFGNAAGLGVKLGGTAASAVTWVSTSQITATVPAISQGSYPVTATNPGGASNTYYSFDVVSPTISVSPTIFTFTAQEGGTNPASQTLYISNSGSGTMNWSVSESETWLTLSPASGSNSGSVTLSVDTAGLTAGTYSAQITVAAPGASNTPRYVTVNLTVTASPPIISLTPLNLDFSTFEGTAKPADQKFQITNTGGGTLDWAVSKPANCTWLSFSPASGTGPAEVTVSADPAGLALGTRTANITVSGTGTASKTVSVSFTITKNTANDPTIYVTPETVTATAYHGSTTPVSVTIHVKNTGGGTLNWTASKNVPWLTLQPSTGTGDSDFVAYIDPSGKAVDTYPAQITVTANGATNTPVAIPVSLNIIEVPPTEPHISVSPSTISLSGLVGVNNLNIPVINVSNPGDKTLNWSAASDAPWLTLGTTSGTDEGAIPLSINMAALLAGDHTATITITAPGADNSPCAVTVNLTLVPLYDEPYNCPNPFNPVTGTKIIFTLDDSSKAKIMIFNTNGKSIWEKSIDTAGPQLVEWDGKDMFGKYVGYGPYLYFIIVDGKVIGKGEMCAFK